MEAKKLPGLVDIIRSSFFIFFKKHNFFYLLKIVLLNFGITLALMLPIMLFASVFSDESVVQNIGPAVTIFVPTIAFAIAMIIWGLLMQATIVVGVSKVVSGTTPTVKETVKIAWGKLGRYFLTNLVTGLIIVVGLLFLIVPGIIFAVWYSFSQYLVITKDIRPIDALKASKALVSGYFWPVLGRTLGIMVFFVIVQIALNFIPVLGPLAVILLAPYFVLAPYLVFDGLRKVKAKS